MTPKEIVTRHYSDARSVQQSDAFKRRYWQIAATVGRKIEVVGRGWTPLEAWINARTKIRTNSKDEYWYELISGRIGNATGPKPSQRKGVKGK